MNLIQEWLARQSVRWCYGWDFSYVVSDNLVIESIQEGDGGTYQCLGENAASDNPLSLIYILDVLSKSDSRMCT